MVVEPVTQLNERLKNKLVDLKMNPLKQIYSNFKWLKTLCIKIDLNSRKVVAESVFQ